MHSCGQHLQRAQHAHTHACNHLACLSHLVDIICAHPARTLSLPPYLVLPPFPPPPPLSPPACTPFPPPSPSSPPPWWTQCAPHGPAPAGSSQSGCTQPGSIECMMMTIDDVISKAHAHTPRVHVQCVHTHTVCGCMYLMCGNTCTHDVVVRWCSHVPQFCQAARHYRSTSQVTITPEGKGRPANKLLGSLKTR